MKHSGFGIASFSLSLLTGFLIFIFVLVAGAAETLSPGGMDETSITAIAIGFAILASGGLTFVALALGIVSLFQKDRSKIFGILGTVVSALVILGTVALVAFGMMIG